MAIKEIVKGICSTTRCKYDVYTKEKMDERLEKIEKQLYTDLLNDCDLNTLLHHGHYSLSYYFTYQNTPLEAGFLHVMNSSEEPDSHGVIQILYSTDGKEMWARGANDAQGTSWTEWVKYPNSGDVYTKTEANNLLPQNIVTNGGPVYAGYKIDGKPVYVARYSYNFGSNQSLEIDTGFNTTNVTLVDFKGIVKGSLYQIPLSYTYVDDASKKFDANTVQCVLAHTKNKIYMQSDATGDSGYIDMYFMYNE